MVYFEIKNYQKKVIMKKVWGPLIYIFVMDASLVRQ